MWDAFAAMMQDLEDLLEGNGNPVARLDALASARQAPQPAAVSAVFGTERPYTVARVEAPTGQAAFKARVEPLAYLDPNGSRIEWTALDAMLTFDASGRSMTVKGSWPSVLVEDATTHPLYAEARAASAYKKSTLDVRSVATIPFSIDRVRSGVLFLRTDRSQRNLTMDDVVFCEVVLRAAVASIRRAQALETTRAENRRLEALATTDPLTRILNRRALLDRLNAEVDRARRYESSLTLLLLDLDHFKEINDTAGHLAGDTVLRRIGVLLEGHSDLGVLVELHRDVATPRIRVRRRYGAECIVRSGQDHGAV
jgi:GAF domain-containing protein